MAYAATKERAHELIDRMVPEQVPVAVDALERLIDPVGYSLANAPFEDEAISEEEEEAVARARAETGPGTSMEDLMVELGFSAEDIERVGRSGLPSGNLTDSDAKDDHVSGRGEARCPPDRLRECDAYPLRDQSVRRERRG